ncbi:MAG: glycosyltransferase family 2 protein [Halioglobus sp.]|nr:glycosyltransferase family 2 protein [Halioglobus sp.]
MLERVKQSVRNLISGGTDETCLLSVIVVAYNMPAQAENTIRSLLPDYQCGVPSTHYEVVIVENASDNTISPAFLQTLPVQFSYHLRQETRPTPVYAINYGLERARGRNICVMIDGARLLTPGVVGNMILGHKLTEDAMVTVPGYHLGEKLQQDAVSSGYDMDHEMQLMQSIAWPDNGYRLFEIACFSGSCKWGFFLSQSESNCISMPRERWAALGGYETRFESRGGGLVNLDLYKRACALPGIQHVVLLGEGSFHQFHGGATTGADDGNAREKVIEDIKKEYQQIRGQKYKAPETDPIFLGRLPPEVQQFVSLSSNAIMQRRNNATARKDVVTSHPEN